MDPLQTMYQDFRTAFHLPHDLPPHYHFSGMSLRLTCFMNPILLGILSYGCANNFWYWHFSARGLTRFPLPHVLLHLRIWCISKLSTLKGVQCKWGNTVLTWTLTNLLWHYPQWGKTWLSLVCNPGLCQTESQETAHSVYTMQHTHPGKQSPENCYKTKQQTIFLKRYIYCLQ